MQQFYKPFHIVLFILACPVLLETVAYFVPTGKKDIFGYGFRFLSEYKLLKKQKRHEVNVDSLFVDIDTTMIGEIGVPDSLCKLSFCVCKKDGFTVNLMDKPKIFQFYRALFYLY